MWNDGEDDTPTYADTVEEDEETMGTHMMMDAITERTTHTGKSVRGGPHALRLLLLIVLLVLCWASSLVGGSSSCCPPRGSLSITMMLLLYTLYFLQLKGTPKGTTCWNAQTIFRLSVIREYVVYVCMYFPSRNPIYILARIYFGANLEGVKNAFYVRREP